MRKTQRLRGFIDSIANLSPKFWRWFMNLGIPVSIFFMAFMIINVIYALIMLFEAPATPGIAPVLPGVDVPGSPVFVPVFAGIVAIIIVMVVHEFGHGILARVEGVSIKSIGIVLFAILPGAFVEPDDEDVMKSGRASKLRIYAAGSVFNLATAGVALVITILLMNFFIPASFHADGLTITSVTPGGPAEGILKEGMEVYSINGYSINSRSDYLEIIINKTKPGDKLTFVTDQGTFVVTSVGQPSNSSVTWAGTRSETRLVVNQDVSDKFGSIIPWILYYLTDICKWTYILSFLVGIFNLLPFWILDGRLIFRELLKYVLSDENSKKITSWMSTVITSILVILIAFGLVPALLKMF